VTSVLNAVSRRNQSVRRRQWCKADAVSKNFKAAFAVWTTKISGTEGR